ncbi:MAG TPA: OstA-like protein [Bacteroidia bacterium]|nr:OstA-like protein [Bacteroidia bacterium]
MIPGRIIRLYFFLLLMVSLLFCLDANYVAAQNKTQVEIDNADTFEGDESLGKNVSRLLGNVRFRHQGALMYCDSAYLYQETNSLDAFGRIRIVQGDSINLTGNFLKYDGNSRQAKVTGNVVMTDRDMVLVTDVLNYNMNSETAEYFDGGKITDKQNVLTSKSGYYFSKDRIVFFKDSVKVVNPKYFILADTLKYQTVSKVVVFEGPTNIYSTGTDSSVIYCENGWYNTITEKSIFKSNAVITSKANRLAGDSLVYDNKTTIGNAFGNVAISDTVQKVIITGDYGYNNDASKYSLVTGRAIMIKIFETDSLFLHADTLYASQDTTTKNRTWIAFHGVRIFKKDLQGKCDSLVYNTSDSTLSFFYEPVLWSDQNQLTAVHMYLRMANSKLDQLYLKDAAFITSKEDTARFNQIKGRNMTGYFIDNKLNSIHVEGNGQSIYYTQNSKKQFTGVNRADCSDMLIFIKESKVNSITMINKPDATMYPINELNVNELKLKGFVWREELRPKSKEDIFLKELK